MTSVRHFGTTNTVKVVNGEKQFLGRWTLIEMGGKSWEKEWQHNIDIGNCVRKNILCICCEMPSISATCNYSVFKGIIAASVFCKKTLKTYA